MNEINQILKYLGITLNINENSEPVLLFALGILILSIISLICIINMILYFSVIYITDKKLLDKLIYKKPILLKLINYYSKIRVYYIIIEIIFLLSSIVIIIWLCCSVIVSFLS